MQFDGTILGIQPASGQIAYRLEPSGPLHEAVKRAFLSKNDKLVFLSPSNRIYEFNQLNKPIADLSDAICQAAVFSADGKYLVRGESQSQDVIVYSLGQKKDIFQFSINEGTAKRMWLTDDNAHLIVYIESSGNAGVVVLDLAKLNAQAGQEFPDVAYLPPELLPDSREDTPNVQTRKEPIRTITFGKPNSEPNRPITNGDVAQKWNKRKLDAEVLFKELLQEQLDKSEQNKELTEAWDNQDRSGWGVNRLNDIAQALANSERYGDAIVACDLSLQKRIVNIDAKIIKAYSLWQQQSLQKAIEILRNHNEDLAKVQYGEFFLKTMQYQIDQAMQNKENHDSQAFLRAVETWTVQHPIFRLTTIVGDSMAQEGLWNLYKLDLVLANEIVSHNSKLPYHWELLARAKLQVGDQAGARQAIEEYVKLMNRLDYQMLLKLRSKAKSQ